MLEFAVRASSRVVMILKRRSQFLISLLVAFALVVTAVGGSSSLVVVT